MSVEGKGSPAHQPIADFAGSIPLPDAETVFRTLAAATGPQLKRLPDGEPGPVDFPQETLRADFGCASQQSRRELKCFQMFFTFAYQCGAEIWAQLERTMRKADLPVPASELPTVRERRESEQLVSDWEQETRRLGDALALMTLDLSAMSGPKWAYRFVIAVRPVVENSSLLFYGASLASLWELADRPDQSIPITAQLPRRYVPVFTKGCVSSTLSSVPVRMQGTVERDDGKQELYRAAFMRLSLDANRAQNFVLGAFNSRMAKRGK